MCGWEGRGAVLGWGVREASLRRVARGQPPEIKGEKQEQKTVKQIRTQRPGYTLAEEGDGM